MPKIAMTFHSLPLRFLCRYLMRHLKINELDPFARASFSQEGEDLILSRFLEPRTKGWYVDIGAHHPKRFSNTYYFYLRGWTGLNIDAMPGSMDKFNRLRPRDINIEVAVAEQENVRSYFVFNDTALNTFNSSLAEERKKLAPYYITDTIPVKCRRLDSILEEYLPENKHIDFMSVDAEGLDLEILRSNDWLRFRPEFLVVECLDLDSPDIHENTVIQFLTEKDYSMAARCFNSIIFRTEVTPVARPNLADPKPIE